MLAAKHFDPVVGVDIHIIQPPGPVPPVPIPHPFVGFLIDPADYVPIIGSTVQINGLHRAQAGTAGKCVPPHIPIGGVFVPPPPGNECEMFMGSATVEIDGEAQSYMSLAALSCQSVGMPSIPRISPKKKTVPKCLMLPTSVVLPIPAGPPVMIGGPPTISLSAMAMKIGLAALGKGLKKLRKLQKGSKKIKALSDKVHAAAKKAMNKLGIPPNVQNKVHRSICSVTGHPVDIATGKVFTDAVDFELPGPLPLKWERVYFTTSVYRGPLGHGWHHSYDVALLQEEDAVVVRLTDGRSVTFPALVPGESYFDRQERLSLGHDSDGYLLQDSSGLSWRFGRVTFDRDVLALMQVENRTGDRIEFCYDKYGWIELIVDSAGRRLPVSTDAGGRILEIRAPHPDNLHDTISLVSYEYDSKGRLTCVRDGMSQPMTFRYTGFLLTQETDRNGLSFYFEYDGADEHARCVHTWGDGGIYNHRLDYDLVLKQTRVTNSLGNSAVHYWNDEGLVFRAIDPLGYAKETVFSEYHQPLVELDELGQATVYGYDDRGNRILTVSPDEAKTEVVFNELDLPVRVLDALGKFWFRTYDEFGQLLSRLDPTGRETRFEYDAKQLSGIIDPAGGVTRISYDSDGNVNGVTLPNGGQSRWIHDRLGRPVVMTDPVGNVERREYDVLNRVVRVLEPDGNELIMRYDQVGNLAYVKDQQHEVHFTYAGTGCMTCRREAENSVSFSFNTEEDLVAVTNEHGLVYRLELDERRQVVREYGFDGIRRIYTRDAAGRIVRQERASGLFALYHYDPAERVTAVHYNDGTMESFAWRKDGQLIEAVNGSCTVRFERDAVGRIVKESQDDYWVSSEYSPPGYRREIRTSTGACQTIERDSLGDVIRMQYRDEKADPSEILWETEIKRDQMGWEMERTLPGGVRSRWQRDTSGRPLHHHVPGAGGYDRDVRYEWGINDRLQKTDDAHRGTSRFEHDKFGNLMAAVYEGGTTELRMPDATGNLFRTPERRDRTYGDSGQILEAVTDTGVVHYQYDKEGNLIRKSDKNGDTFYHWNAAGMLSSVQNSKFGEITFAYDALGRRIKKTSGTSSVLWRWDGDNPVQEWYETDLAAKVEGGPPSDIRGQFPKVPVVFIFDPETSAPALMVQGNVACSIVTDYLGTPCRTIDSMGQTTWDAALSVYGEAKVAFSRNGYCPFRWPGQYEDVETGLHYNRFRYYDHESGQYISQDPIRLTGGLELYAYASDPLWWTDPLGLACYAATRTNGGVARGRKLSQKQALARIRRGLDVMTDSASEAISLAKRAMRGKPMRHAPHGIGSGYLPHVHPAQHANTSHIFYPT